MVDRFYRIKYIEKFDAGFTYLIDGCRVAGFPDSEVYG